MDLVHTFHRGYSCDVFGCLPCLKQQHHCRAPVYEVGEPFHLLGTSEHREHQHPRSEIEQAPHFGGRVLRQGVDTREQLGAPQGGADLGETLDPVRGDPGAQAGLSLLLVACLQVQPDSVDAGCIGASGEQRVIGPECEHKPVVGDHAFRQSGWHVIKHLPPFGRAAYATESP